MVSYLFAPIPEALRQEFPEIQYATVCRRRYGAVLYHGEESVQAPFDDGGFPHFSVRWESRC